MIVKGDFHEQGSPRKLYANFRICHQLFLLYLSRAIPANRPNSIEVLEESRQKETGKERLQDENFDSFFTYLPLNFHVT